MADAPPPGPPPPKVPEGWKAVWNDKYSEWFFVNTYTKESTWEKPTAPAHRPDADAPPGGPPPSYSGSGAMPGCGNEKHNPNNPYNQAANVDDDAKLAARLQAEEEARVKAGGNADRGAADSYYQTGGNNQSYGAPPQSSPYGQQGGISPYGGGASGPTSPPYDQNQQPQGGDGKRGLLGKLLGKASKPHGGGGYGQQGYPPQGYPQHQQGYPQQGYGGYPQQGYGGYPPQQPMYAQQPPKKSGGGLGMAGGAALGLGGGLVGGMLLEDAIDDHDEHEQDQGYDQGYDDGGGDGGDMGGGDF